MSQSSVRYVVIVEVLLLLLALSSCVESSVAYVSNSKCSASSLCFYEKTR